MNDLEQRVAALETEVRLLRDQLNALRGEPVTCGRSWEVFDGRDLRYTTSCVLARGHAGHCDPSTPLKMGY